MCIFSFLIVSNDLGLIGQFLKLTNQIDGKSTLRFSVHSSATKWFVGPFIIFASHILYQII